MYRLGFTLFFFLCSALFGLQPIDSDKVEYTHSNVQYGIVGKSELHKEFRQYIKFKEEGKNLIGYIKILKNSAIDEATFLYVKHALNKFAKAGVIFVLFHLDSFGGDIFPTLKIADLLQKMDITQGISTITFIDKHALSAAAMIPYASRFIAVTKDSYMGGHFPNESDSVFVSSSEKIRAMLKEEFSGLANFYKRNPVLAEAMVDTSMIVVDREGKIVSLESEAQINSLGDKTDKVLATDKQNLTLDASELLKYGIADFSIPLGFEKGPSKAKYWPFKDSPLDEEPFLHQIPNTEVYNYQNWKISLYEFLTHPLVAALLLIVLVTCCYIQLHLKKFNAFGFVGIASLVAILIISYTIRSFSLIETIILVLGIVLFLAEIFLIPGFGTIGILGIILMIIGLFSLLLPGIQKFSVFDFESFSVAANSLLQRLIWLVCALIIGCIGIFIIRRLFARKLRSISRLVIPKAQQTGEVDFLEEYEEEQLPKVDTIAVTHCTLRPFGKVIVEDKIYDAISYQRQEIHKHLKVIVIDHENGKVVVKPVEEKPTDSEKKS